MQTSLVVITQSTLAASTQRAKSFSNSPSTTRLCLGGAGAAKARLAADLLQLTGDPIHEAEQLTQLAQFEPQRTA